MCVWGFREQAFHGVHYPLDSEDGGSRTMQSAHKCLPFCRRASVLLVAFQAHLLHEPRIGVFGDDRIELRAIVIVSDWEGQNPRL